MNYAQLLAGELRGAFERQDHPAFTRLLTRMVAAISYTGPGSIAPHSDERLDEETMQMLRKAGPTGPVVLVAGPTVPTLSCVTAEAHRGKTAMAMSTTELMKGTPNCTRTDGCQCKTWPQAKTCMHRRTS